MKILVMSHSCVVGVNQQLFVALRRLPDIELELIMPAKWHGEYNHTPILPDLLPEVDFPVHLQPVALGGNVSLHFYRRLPWKQLLHFQPDVVLSAQEPWSLSGWQALLIARRTRAAFVFQTNQNLLKFYPWPFARIEQTAFAQADLALAFSEEAREVMKSKGRSGPSAVLPYGTDLTLFYPGRSTVRARLGLENCLVVGSMGRLVHEKGLDLLIRALPPLMSPQSEIPIKLLLVGSGAEESKLRQLAVEVGVEDRVIFTGAVPHSKAGAYMRCMDIFVLPSRTMPNWKEQFGRVIIEAMACQIPVVGSDSGQIPCLIRETGGGLVFREDDIEDLTDKLQSLLALPSLRERLGQVGAENVRCRYTYDHIALLLHRYLQEAIDIRHLQSRDQ